MRPLRATPGWLTIIALAAVAAVNLVGLWGIRVARQGALEEARRAFEVDLSLRAGALETRLGGVRSDLAFLADSPTLEWLEATRLRRRRGVAAPAGRRAHAAVVPAQPHRGGADRRALGRRHAAGPRGPARRRAGALGLVVADRPRGRGGRPAAQAADRASERDRQRSAARGRSLGGDRGRSRLAARAVEPQRERAPVPDPRRRGHGARPRARLARDGARGAGPADRVVAGEVGGLVAAGPAPCCGARSPTARRSAPRSPCGPATARPTRSTSW